MSDSSAVPSAILSLSFGDDDVRWMRTLPALQRVPETVFEFLRQYRFSGDVWALPEGTPFFPNEPLVRVGHAESLGETPEDTLALGGGGQSRSGKGPCGNDLRATALALS